MIVASSKPAMLFDLDGTLVDSVYQHALAWSDALRAEGIDLPLWRIHRRIGMSGGLFVRGLVREIGREVDRATQQRLVEAHAESYRRHVDSVRPLPGARRLLTTLTASGIPWAIATSGRRDVATGTVAVLNLDVDVPVVTRDDVAYAKPNPDLFVTAADRLGVPINGAFVIGDSVWDLLAAQRAGALGIGFLSGGYGRQELELSGAYRVYDEPLDLLRRLDELGIRDVSASWTNDD
jgi:HAD superfamily hydrolase (TIGR01509 family)